MAPNYSKLITKNNVAAGAGILGVAWYLAFTRKNKNLNR